MTLFTGKHPGQAALREAAWVARCVGRAETAPLDEEDIRALASYLSPKRLEPGALLFPSGEPSAICILRTGLLELSFGAGRRRVVLNVLRPGDVDGDIQLLLNMSVPYATHALYQSQCLLIDASSFELLIVGHPAVARRWLSSVAQRLARNQARLLELLGKSLRVQTARLLLDEAVEGTVPFSQRTLAAMLGVQRPSLNKVLRALQSEGLVEVGYREVRIRESTELETAAARTP